MPRIFLSRVLSAVATSFVFAAVAAAAPMPPVPNGDFSQGETTPSDWKLSGGEGRWVDHSILEVTGKGSDSNSWSCKYSFAPGALYRFQMRARCPGGNASAICGPSFANFDQPISDDWTWCSHVFRTMDVTTPGELRVGQWQVNGSLQFDAVRLAPVMPVYRKVGNLPLGEGESISAGRYDFDGSFAHEGHNFHRTLVSSTAYFNTDRYCLSDTNQVTYRFELPGYPFRSGKVRFALCHHTRGGCLAEISRDQKTWRRLATQDKLGSAAADVPADLLPADVLFVRLRCTTKDSNLQVSNIGFSAELTGTPQEGAGQTVFAEIAGDCGDLVIDNVLMDDSTTPDRPLFRVMAKNRGTAAVDATLSLAALPRKSKDGLSNEKPFSHSFGSSTEIAPSATQEWTTKTLLQHCGVYDIQLAVRAASGKALTLTLPWTLPNYFASDYGQRIDGVEGDHGVWWCESAWKVHPQRAIPQTATPAAAISAARNDREALQIVVRPKTELKRFTATIGELHGPNGAVIPSDKMAISRVYYHNVQTPTDGTSVRGEWPDALPPLDQPIDLPAEKNQPLWVLIHVPKDAPAGDFTGTVALKADGWAATVPVKLHVWSFTLPEKNHLDTAFGLSMQRPFQYHQAKTDADRRKIVDMYLKSFAEHRISPYDPVPLDHIRVKFVPEANPPRADLDFTAFDAAMSHAIEKYHVTNFLLPIEGMGGGTFEGRSEGQIGKYGEHTPEYQAMFASYLKQLESHLREKGWLDMAYTYWFDEPEPKDYDFVRRGMERLKKCAPGIHTMLTEQPEEALAGPIDIWCPISYEYRQKAADARRAHGERFWWYVCCGPKEPFCTLFIDHPATDLRVWLWQTWQRNIKGILVWESAYWTSQDEPRQNPYADPMGYVGGSRPDEHRYWGNGDGRFVYPPLAAAVNTPSANAILERPVSSIRFEMLREGIEDYEYLWLLHDLIEKNRNSLPAEQVKRYEALLEVPATITTSATEFTFDARPIYKRRAAIAEAIERLAK